MSTSPSATHPAPKIDLNLSWNVVKISNPTPTSLIISPQNKGFNDTAPPALWASFHPNARPWLQLKLWFIKKCLSYNWKIILCFSNRSMGYHLISPSFSTKLGFFLAPWMHRENREQSQGIMKEKPWSLTREPNMGRKPWWVWGQGAKWWCTFVVFFCMIWCTTQNDGFKLMGAAVLGVFFVTLPFL